MVLKSDIVLTMEWHTRALIRIKSPVMPLFQQQSKYQSSALLTLCWGIHRWPVNFPLKELLMRKAFPWHDVIISSKYTHQKVCQSRDIAASTQALILFPVPLRHAWLLRMLTCLLNRRGEWSLSHPVAYWSDLSVQLMACRLLWTKPFH